MTRDCAFCGRPFEADRKSRRFCSIRCTNDSKCHGVTIVTCQRCGKAFEVRSCRLKRGFGKFCSRACAAAIAGRNLQNAYVEKYRATWKRRGEQHAQPLPPPPAKPPDMLPMLQQILAAVQARPGTTPAELPAPRDIEELAGEYKEVLLARGNTEHHAHYTFHKIVRVMRLAGISLTTEVEATKLELAIGGLREKYAPEGLRAIFRAVRAFMHYLVDRELLARDPMKALRMPRAGDPVHPRRALSDEEIRRLLETTAANGVVRNVPAAERLLFYEFQLSTGLRLGETWQLTSSMLVLDDPNPHVSVRGSISKSGKPARQPLPASLAAKLRAHVAGRDPDAPVFKLTRSKCDVVRMLRADLRKARIAWLDEAGRGSDEWKQRLRSGFLSYVDPEGRIVDIHSLRHTFISRAARVYSPAIVQQLARHSDVELTMRVYVHVTERDKFQAIEGMPELPAANSPANKVE